MNVSGSTIGPPQDLRAIGRNGIVYSNAASDFPAGFTATPSGTVSDSTIFGTGAMIHNNSTGPFILTGAKNVTITHNTLTSDPSELGSDEGAFVLSGAGGTPSTSVVISFNHVARSTPDDPDLEGVGIAVCSSDAGALADICGPVKNPSSAKVICNTFSGWNTNIVGGIQVSCTPPPDGTECQAYSADMLSVEGGTAPFTWSVESGSLPPGLTLAASGAITGTPTAAGTFHFTMKVVDSTGLTATKAQTITIAPGGCATIDKEADSPTVTAGGLAGYRITVNNPTRHIARNLWICDRIPSQMTFVRATRRLRVFRRMRCLVIARLLPHHSTSFHLTLRVASNAPNGTETNIGEVIPGGPVTPGQGPGNPGQGLGNPGNKPPPVKKPIGKAKPIAKAKAKVKVRVRHRHPAPPPPVTG